MSSTCGDFQLKYHHVSSVIASESSAMVGGRPRRADAAPATVCQATEPVRSDSNCSSDRDGMLTRCKLLERAAGAVDARGDAPQRLETSIRYKMRLRSRELTRDSIDVIRCND